MKPLTTAVLVLAAVFVAALPNANADYFYWVKAPLKTHAVKSGYSFAVTALHAESAGNVRRMADEVTGTIGRTYVAITCVGTVPQVTAIVAAVGPDSAETARVRDAVTQRIKGVVSFD